MAHESAEDAWSARFGTKIPTGVPDMSPFLRHRSVRKYKSDPVSDGLLAGLIGCAQSASTSSNLQLWSVVSVHDQARRREVASLCASQDQILAAPVFLAFFADHARLRQAGAAVAEPCLGLDFNEFFTMAVIDASLAAERLACAAEHIGLGVCYIGALRNDPHAVHEFFRAPIGVAGLFGMCIGWPEPDSGAEIKPRLPQASVWHRETFAESSIGDFDERMREFYSSQGMKGDVTWSMRSARRVDETHLTGREAMKPFLGEQGFDLR